MIGHRGGKEDRLMSRQLIAPRLPWANRWTEPTTRQLLEPIQETHRKPFEHVFKQVGAIDRVRRSLIWYGLAWQWTFLYELLDEAGKVVETLCYLVPRTELPLLCVPLSESLVQRLPMRRLGKVARDGVRTAPCAIKMHWAVWSPANQTEAIQLLDLIKRKHKLVLFPKEPAKASR